MLPATIVDNPGDPTGKRVSVGEIVSEHADDEPPCQREGVEASYVCRIPAGVGAVLLAVILHDHVLRGVDQVAKATHRGSRRAYLGIDKRFGQAGPGEQQAQPCLAGRIRTSTHQPDCPPKGCGTPSARTPVKHMRQIDE